MPMHLERRPGCLSRGLAALLIILPVVASGAEPETEKSGSPARKHYFRSFLGKKPVELETEANHWVNSEDKLTLQQLHGKVVWLEFNF